MSPSNFPFYLKHYLADKPLLPPIIKGLFTLNLNKISLIKIPSTHFASNLLELLFIGGFNEHHDVSGKNKH